MCQLYFLATAFTPNQTSGIIVGAGPSKQQGTEEMSVAVSLKYICFSFLVLPNFAEFLPVPSRCYCKQAKISSAEDCATAKICSQSLQAPRRIPGKLDARPGLDLGTAEQFVWENEREYDERCVDYDHAASSRLITITTTTIASTGAASVVISSGPSQTSSSRAGFSP
ncbi:hypothetical protein R3P38DRAFT_3350630 [Favolaschia claudopus]|uniref:Uncharacterized protein n=1 Tax=Favolaschia claudopus TaxID=2862362 RepID=A0AAW0CEZ4_9AGAR